METILKYSELVLSILLILVILLQAKGSSLGAAFGGDTEIYNSKRGPEKFLHIATIVLVVLFFATAIVRIVI